MTEATTLNFNDFDVNDIVFQPMEVKTPKMKIVRLRSKTLRKSGLRFYSPVLSTYGFRDFEDDKKYKLGLTFDANNFITDEARALREKLFEIQNKIKEQAIGENWFAPKVVKTLDSVENIFTDFIKFGKDKTTEMPDPEKAAYYNLKLVEYDGVFNIKIYDNRRNELFPTCDLAKDTDFSGLDMSSPPLTLIPANIKTQVRVLFEISSLWFIGGRFGVTCTATEIIIHKVHQAQVGCSIPFDPELDIESEVITKGNNKRSLTVYDSDNEDEKIVKKTIKKEVEECVEESKSSSSSSSSSSSFSSSSEAETASSEGRTASALLTENVDNEDEEVDDEDSFLASPSSGLPESSGQSSSTKKRRTSKKAKEIGV